MSSNEKSERLIEAAAAILNAAPDRRLNAVVLNKALFYLDLASLRDRGETVTHNSYIALEKGLLATGDLVVVTAGSPFGVPGTSNMMLLKTIVEWQQRRKREGG